MIGGTHEEHLVSYLGFTMFKMKRVVDEYRELYPRGRLRLLFIVACAATLIGLAGVAVSLLLVQRVG